MLKAIAFAAATLAGTALLAEGHTNPDMVTVESAHSVIDTLDRMEAAIEENGARVFARVDHSRGARSVSMDLPPTELLIFGNPQLGTPAMQASRTMGLDLPLRALAWEHEDGTVYVTYPKAEALAATHGVDPESEMMQRIATALENLVGGATAAD
ncbi:DUF302 domain-containing protein [Roseobacter sp. HKCCA0434]|uniref:DUF302 domain-containing protein n=1 Tax=Roseobacter sp. HKCCA0434 TaxID=3079297 RepID=UPI002905B4B8|nr:DUF302 domain-containing protein [Roseobacter sp. HKCCA0434]